MKHQSLVQFVFKSACFLRKQILQFSNSLSILNTKETNNGIFSNKAGENFNLAKMFLNVRVQLKDFSYSKARILFYVNT